MTLRRQGLLAVCALCVVVCVVGSVFAVAQDSIDVGLGNVRGNLLALGDMNNDRQ